MKGINFLTNDKGEKTAVVIDLKQYKEAVEDFLDGLEANSRVNEPSVDFIKASDKIIKSKSKKVVSNKNKKIGRERIK
jgi:hypothetical protein